MASKDPPKPGTTVELSKGAGGGLTTTSPFSHAAIPIRPSPQPSDNVTTTQSPPAPTGPAPSETKK